MAISTVEAPSTNGNAPVAELVDVTDAEIGTAPQVATSAEPITIGGRTAAEYPAG